MTWKRSNVISAFGRLSPTPAMKALDMSELVLVISSGSPPWATRSAANALTVLASRPSLANSTRPNSRSMKTVL
jgi:hypothetical protein